MYYTHQSDNVSSPKSCTVCAYSDIFKEPQRQKKLQKPPFRPGLTAKFPIQDKTLWTELNKQYQWSNFKAVQEDWQGADIFYIISIVAALDKLNGSSMVKEAEKCRELIVRLMKQVEPPGVMQLQFKVKTLWTKEQRADLIVFAEQLAEYAEHVQGVNTAVA